MEIKSELQYCNMCYMTKIPSTRHYRFSQIAKQPYTISDKQTKLAKQSITHNTN